jgi:hypothetical protein
MRLTTKLFVNLTVLSLCLALGVVYGFIFAVFPPFFLVYAAIPLAGLAFLVIWALPEAEAITYRPFIAAFMLTVGAKLLWPEYLAPNIPGLPAVSLGRISIVLLMLTMIVTLSMSRSAKARLVEVLSALPIWKVLIALNFIQLYTIFLSVAPFRSFNQVLVTLQAWTGIYIASVLAFSIPRVRAWFPRFLIVTTLLLCLLGMAELQNQALLWSKNFPSFLRYDQVIAGILEPKFRDGGYRVTTIYTTSLSFAEFLAFASPFFLHNLLRARALMWRAFWVAANMLLVFTILKTGARLGIIGLFTADAVYMMLWSFRRWRLHHKSDLIGPAMSLAFPVAAVLFLVSMFTVDAVRFRTIAGGSTGFSDDARWTQLEMAMPSIVKNPLGYGLGSSGEVIGFMTPGGQLTVDSYVLTVLVDLGVAGLILYAGMLFWTMWRMGRIAFESQEEGAFITACVTASLASWVTAKLVLSQADNDMLLFIMLGYATALAWHYRATGTARAPAAAAEGYPAGRRVEMAPIS